VSLGQAMSAREKFNLQKTHSNDAVVVAASRVSIIDTAECFEFNMKQHRRHSRARTSTLRDRLYKLDKEIVARNRNKKADQKEDSLTEFRDHSPELVGRLKVYPGKRSLKPFRKNMFTVAGDIWQLPDDRRFVSGGIVSRTNIHSLELVELIGKSYVSPRGCTRILKNEGMVVF